MKKSNYKVAIGLGLILLSFILAGPNSGNYLACQEPENEERLMDLRKLTVHEVVGTLDLQGDTPTARLTVTLENPANRSLKARITLSKALEKEVSIMAHSLQKVDWEAPVEIKRTTKLTSLVRLSSFLKIKEINEFKPAAQINVDVLIPKDAKKLIWSNKKLAPSARTSDNRQTYKWTGENQFATTLALMWTNSSTDIEVEKSIQPDWQNRQVLVLLKVRNQGTTPAENILLEDDFPVQDYVGIANKSEGQFEIYKGEENDQRLLWKHQLPTIRAGGQVEVKLYLMLKYDLRQIRLYETRALEDGEPIAFSESVQINR